MGFMSIKQDWLKSALDFDTLPSERSSVTPAARLLRRLAEKAAWGLHNYRGLRRIDRPKEHLDFYTKPGAFIESRCSPEEREILQSLSSEDAVVLGFAKEWLDDGRPT